MYVSLNPKFFLEQTTRHQVKYKSIGYHGNVALIDLCYCVLAHSPWVLCIFFLAQANLRDRVGLWLNMHEPNIFCTLQILNENFKTHGFLQCYDEILLVSRNHRLQTCFSFTFLNYCVEIFLLHLWQYKKSTLPSLLFVTILSIFFI